VYMQSVANFFICCIAHRLLLKLSEECESYHAEFSGFLCIKTVYWYMWMYGYDLCRDLYCMLCLTDIVMPSSHLPVAKTDVLPQVSVDSSLIKVLTWNPNWLYEYGMSYSSVFILCMNLLWPPNKAGHYILQWWFLSSFFIFSFFPCCLFSAITDWMLTTWCGLSANLECRSEMCCTQLAENTGCQNSPSAHHRTTLSSYIFATKTCIDNWKTC